MSKRALLAACASACLLLAQDLPLAAQGVYFPGKADDWERREPRQLGLDPRLIREAVAFAQASETDAPRDLELNHYLTFGREPFGDAIGPFKERGENTGLIIREGYIVAEWGDLHRVDPTFSVTKSFLSATVGLAFDRGLIRDVNDRVAPYMAPILVLGDRLAPPGSSAERLGQPQLFEPFTGPHADRITWDHLLRQTSDWEGTLWGKPDWADRPDSDLRAAIHRARHEPGTTYEYNDVRVNLLALAALNVWRRPLPEVLKEHLMDPIGASGTWRWYGYENSWVLLDGLPMQSVSGGAHWGGGLFISALDLARFGYLTLHRGRWAGQQILSEEWLRLSRTPTPAQPNYGFMNWFLNQDRRELPAGPTSAFLHIGAGNNLVYVDPEHDLVIVARWITRAGFNGLVERVLGAMDRAERAVAATPISGIEQAALPATVVPSDFAPSLGTAGFAKVLCSAVFVSGREPAEAAQNSAYWLFPDAHHAITDTMVDYRLREVRLTYAGTITRTARYYGDQGCIIHPEGFHRVFFEPVQVTTSLPDPATQAWPMGDRLDEAQPPPDVDALRLAASVDSAFADTAALTTAFLVVHRGRILAERYGMGAHQEMQLESWSMGKSLTATLIGLLIQKGVLQLDDVAPVKEWQRSPGDPRSRIRIRDLLQMSSGLHFSAPRDPDYARTDGYSDHIYIYTGGVDAFQHSVTRPLQFRPGTQGRYRNSDPLTLGHLIRAAVESRGENYHTFPQRALFDRLGIRRQVLETDPYGNFLLTGFDYGTARNWARLGLLYLADGVWLGERLLPEGWSTFVSTPGPGWEQPVYGGQFWINGTGEWQLPRDAYYMAGAGGQYTFIVPSHELVVVRMGHFRGSRAAERTLNAALAELMQAIPERTAGDSRGSPPATGIPGAH